MKFINEDLIEKTIAHLGADSSNFETALKELESNQPALLSYLLSEDTQAFTNTEKEWLLFAALVIYQSTQTFAEGRRMIREKEVLDAEEKNWETIQANKTKSFRDRLNPFFESTEQEDLLAFIEDGLILEEDENMISSEGRESLFIMLKTITDVLTK